MFSALDRSLPKYYVRPREGIAQFPSPPRAELIVAGEYQDVLEAPDGKWLLAVKGSAAGPKSLVKIELSTRQEMAVNFPVTDKLKLLAVIPGANRFLFVNEPRSTEAKAYVLSPTTDAIESVKGDFRPLPRGLEREFQPTGHPDEVWAAVPNSQTTATDIGRYNVQTFVFTPLLAIPSLRFKSSSIWVNEAAKQVYVVYRNHLLRFPLQP